MSFRGSAGIVLVLGVSGCREDEKPVPTQPTLRAAVEAAAADELASGRLSPVEFERAREAALEEMETTEAPAAESGKTVTSTDGFFAGYETRDHQLWLHSGARPRRYTVKDKLGNVLAADIDDERLKRDYPDLHDLVHESVDASRLIGTGFDD